MKADVLVWPKSSFRFFCKTLWKNLNELVDQPNAYQLKEIQAKIITEISSNLSPYEPRKEAATLEPIHEGEIELHQKEKRGASG